jgi:hypothetical protein
MINLSVAASFGERRGLVATLALIMFSVTSFPAGFEASLQARRRPVGSLRLPFWFSR